MDNKQFEALFFSHSRIVEVHAGSEPSSENQYLPWASSGAFWTVR